MSVSRFSADQLDGLNRQADELLQKLHTIERSCPISTSVQKRSQVFA